MFNTVVTVVVKIFHEIYEMKIENFDLKKKNDFKNRFQMVENCYYNSKYR